MNKQACLEGYMSKEANPYPYLKGLARAGKKGMDMAKGYNKDPMGLSIQSGKNSVREGFGRLAGTMGIGGAAGLGVEGLRRKTNQFFQQDGPIEYGRHDQLDMPRPSSGRMPTQADAHKRSSSALPPQPVSYGAHPRVDAIRKANAGRQRGTGYNGPEGTPYDSPAATREDLRSPQDLRRGMAPMRPQEVMAPMRPQEVMAPMRPQRGMSADTILENWRAATTPDFTDKARAERHPANVQRTEGLERRARELHKQRILEGRARELHNPQKHR